MGFMAHLLTGWQWFLEENQFLATANFLKLTDTTRKFSQGVFESSAGTSIPRGAAWGIRSLVQAATLTPDDDPLRAQFVASVDANINHYHAKYIAQANNPLGLVEPYDHYNGNVADQPWQSSPWMDDFVTAAFGYLKDTAAWTTTQQTKLDAFLAWKYRAVVGRLGGSATDKAIAYTQGAQYTVYFAPRNDANFATGAGPWYADWGQVATAMGLPTSAAAGAPLASGYPTEPTGYWGNLMPALSYAVDHGATGAAAAFARVSAASNFPTLAAGFNDNPVWGVKPR
jgi:hypothetical protein